MKKKIIIPSGIGAGFFWIIMFLFGIICVVIPIGGGRWQFFPIGFFVDFLLYFIGLHQLFNVVIISENRIIVHRSWTFIEPFQHSINIDIKSIEVATFSYYRDTIESANLKRHWLIPILTFESKSKEKSTLILLGYSKSDKEKIKKILSDSNHSIQWKYNGSFHKIGK